MCVATGGRGEFLGKQRGCWMFTTQRSPLDPGYEIVGISYPINLNKSWSTSFVRDKFRIVSFELEVFQSNCTFEFGLNIDGPNDPVFVVPLQKDTSG